jgi:hypothetical protein
MHEIVLWYAFHDGLNTNVDLGSLNKFDKCRDEIMFYSKFVNLGTCFI